MKTPACEADNERRQRAIADEDFISRDGPMERRISFRVGYNHADMGCGHGKHGMEMRFTLIGPDGATVWAVCMTNWYPGNYTDFIELNATEPISAIPIGNSKLGDAMAWDLGYHSPVPTYEGQDEYLPRQNCHLLPDGYCYYDGSGLNAMPVLKAFIEHGPMAVWAALARYYGELWGPGSYAKTAALGDGS